MSSSETENSERRFPPPGTGACLRLFPREHGVLTEDKATALDGGSKARNMLCAPSWPEASAAGDPSSL
jgi:hypothetical protein